MYGVISTLQAHIKHRKGMENFSNNLGTQCYRIVEYGSIDTANKIIIMEANSLQFFIVIYVNIYLFIILHHGWLNH